MPTSPHLSDQQVKDLGDLLTLIREKLTAITAGDSKAIHHARRYIWKRLEFDERGTPAQRNKLRLILMGKQQSKCAICKEPLPAKEDSDLDRLLPEVGYTEENTRLIHRTCHRREQAAKNFG